MIPVQIFMKGIKSCPPVNDGRLHSAGWQTHTWVLPSTLSPHTVPAPPANQTPPLPLPPRPPQMAGPLLLPEQILSIELLFINTLRPRENGQHFADDIFKRIFFNENV